MTIQRDLQRYCYDYHIYHQFHTDCLQKCASRAGWPQIYGRIFANVVIVCIVRIRRRVERRRQIEIQTERQSWLPSNYTNTEFLCEDIDDISASHLVRTFRQLPTGHLKYRAMALDELWWNVSKLSRDELVVVIVPHWSIRSEKLARGLRRQYLRAEASFRHIQSVLQIELDWIGENRNSIQYETFSSILTLHICIQRWPWPQKTTPRQPPTGFGFVQNKIPFPNYASYAYAVI
jgi:hypothetical protein